MKAFKLLIGILISVSSFSQTNGYLKLSDVSMVTLDRDTLFLKDDDLGRRILSTWDMAHVSPNDRPTILLVAEFPPYPSVAVSSKKSKRKNKK